MESKLHSGKMESHTWEAILKVSKHFSDNKIRYIRVGKLCLTEHIQPLPVFVNKALLETAPPIPWDTVYGCFVATKAVAWLQQRFYGPQS